MQQACHAAMWMEDEDINPRILVGDRDREYPDGFDGFWKPDVRCIRIPPRAPNANAFAEDYIATAKREAPNHY